MIKKKKPELIKYKYNTFNYWYSTFNLTDRWYQKTHNKQQYLMIFTGKAPYYEPVIPVVADRGNFQYITDTLFRLNG